MRFEDVSYRFGAIVERENEDDKGHGLPLNVAIPHFAKMRAWQAIYGGYSWVIGYEPGVPEWTDEQKAQAVGYRASYRRIGDTDSSKTIKIDGGPWDTFIKAEEACKQVWKQLRSLS